MNEDNIIDFNESNIMNELRYLNYSNNQIEKFEIMMKIVDEYAIKTLNHKANNSNSILPSISNKENISMKGVSKNENYHDIKKLIYYIKTVLKFFEDRTKYYSISSLFDKLNGKLIPDEVFDKTNDTKELYVRLLTIFLVYYQNYFK